MIPPVWIHRFYEELESRPGNWQAPNLWTSALPIVKRWRNAAKRLPH